MGDIVSATPYELLLYLVHLSDEPDKAQYDVESETKRYLVVIQHLMQHHTSRRALRLSRIALAVSALAALFAALRVWLLWK
ncbi:MAG: hypothetical protein ABSH34_37965 [Verrucomicrobiota bacterium]|jgi:hypothetical protein